MFSKINTQKTKSQKGFLITEVLVTIFLIVITMVGILPLLFGGIKSSKISKVRAVMTSLGQKEIESFNQKNFSALYSDIKSHFKEQCSSDIICIGETIQNFELGSINYEPTPEQLCVNTLNGEISPYSVSCANKALIQKSYSYLRGDAINITDDVIKYSINIRIIPETTKPVELSAILGRNKLQN